MSNITEVATQAFQQEVLCAGQPVLVDFYAPWCGRGNMIAPILEHLAVEFDGRVAFRKVNVDDEPELTARYGVNAVPTLVIWKDGAIRGRMAGLSSVRALRARLEELAPATIPAEAR